MATTMTIDTIHNHHVFHNNNHNDHINMPQQWRSMNDKQQRKAILKHM